MPNRNKQNNLLSGNFWKKNCQHCFSFRSPSALLKGLCSTTTRPFYRLEGERKSSATRVYLFLSIALVAMTIVAVSSAVVAATEKAHPGKESFENFCASCHGYDGIPNLPGTPNFSIGERLDKKDKELLQAISEGKGDVMPAWKSDLSAQAQQDALNYIKELIHQKSVGNNK